jgi:hypothetical protein
MGGEREESCEGGRNERERGEGGELRAKDGGGHQLKNQS